MKRTIFILVPSPHPTGPVKGAYALANALVSERRVVLVTLKHGPGVDATLDPRVELRSLADVAGWRGRLRAYRAMLREAGGRASVASVSMCLSADLINSYCRAFAVTCASVRGNLLRNYRHDYGLPGTLFAVSHLVMLRSVDHVVTMTASMAEQVRFYTRSLPAVIGNFVDETALEAYRIADTSQGPLRFVFVGSLSERKQPGLVVRALGELHRRGYQVELDLVGDGPSRQQVETEVATQGLREMVRLHGHVRDPHPVIARADALVLPSLSEGVSRAALEALYLGVPCVLRGVDGNAELIGEHHAGQLFSRDDELASAMSSAAIAGRKFGKRTSLLPSRFRQAIAAQQYLTLLEETT